MNRIKKTWNYIVSQEKSKHFSFAPLADFKYALVRSYVYSLVKCGFLTVTLRGREKEYKKSNKINSIEENSHVRYNQQKRTLTLPSGVTLKIPKTRISVGSSKSEQISVALRLLNGHPFQIIDVILRSKELDKDEDYLTVFNHLQRLIAKGEAWKTTEANKAVYRMV